MISLDPGPDDSLYRIRRESQGWTRIRHVTIDKGIIPDEDFKSTYGPSVVRELQKPENLETERLNNRSRTLAFGQLSGHLRTRRRSAAWLAEAMHLTEQYPMISLFELESQQCISQHFSTTGKSTF